jgi:hypothetical protein
LLRVIGYKAAVSTRWARARAAVITFFVLFNALAALPTPGEPSPERLERPFEREELQRWSELLTAVGINTDPGRLGRVYLGFSTWALQARALCLAPIEGWMALTQTYQGWRLFGTPDRDVSALRVTVHSAGGAEVVYESGDPERRWNAAFLEYRRIRAEYSPSRRGPPPTYAGFAKRLSDELFSSMPHVERVTVALVETSVRLPHEAPSSEANAADERVDDVLEFTRPGA